MYGRFWVITKDKGVETSGVRRITSTPATRMAVYDGTNEVDRWLIAKVRSGPIVAHQSLSSPKLWLLMNSKVEEDL